MYLPEDMMKEIMLKTVSGYTLICQTNSYFYKLSHDETFCKANYEKFYNNTKMKEHINKPYSELFKICMHLNTLGVPKNHNILQKYNYTELIIHSNFKLEFLRYMHNVVKITFLVDDIGTTYPIQNIISELPFLTKIIYKKK